jgi:hypothetical protein
MAQDSELERPEPVSGTEFHSSPAKALGGLAGGIFLTGLGVLVVVWRLGWIELFDRRPNLLFTILAGIVGLFGPILFIYSLLQMFRRRRLILGKDRVQIVDSAGGEDVVVAQAAYANIERLIVLQTETGKQINVKLIDRSAAGTFDTINAVRPRDDAQGHNLVIEDHYQGRIEDLSYTLEEALAAWRDKNRGTA